MGYGYAETFLIIFLTHPGVIIPTISAVIGKATSFIPPDLAGFIPSSGAPTTMSALWQVFWVWVLSKPGEKSAGFAWTMYAIYLVFVLLYMYVAGPLRFGIGV